jgi:hypothetical protein
MNTEIKKLREAVAFAEKRYPLPRCIHGGCLRDAAGELLEPSCGCWVYQMDPDFRRDAPEHGAYCVRCQKPIMDPSKAVSVTVDWNTWLVTEGGSELMGADCWTITQRTHPKRGA